jgi:hypothetical protein
VEPLVLTEHVVYQVSVVSQETVYLEPVEFLELKEIQVHAEYLESVESLVYQVMMVPVELKA